MATTLTIDQEDYEEIIKVVGFPFVDIAEDNLELSEDQIKQHIILSSMKEYYRWFPEPLIFSSVIDGGAITVDYPDEFVYGVMDARPTKYEDTLSTSQAFGGNPFVTHRYIYRNNTYNTLGSRYDYGFRSIRHSNQFTRDSDIQQLQVFRINDQPHNRKVEVYYSLRGSVDITFAKWSGEFDRIPFDKKRDVIELCQAELLLFLGHLRNQVDSDFPVAFDADAFIARGENLKDNTMTRWKNYSKGVAMRGSKF